MTKERDYKPPYRQATNRRLAMVKYRLRPRGFAAFVRTAVAQRRAFGVPWSDAMDTAWRYGPIR